MKLIPKVKLVENKRSRFDYWSVRIQGLILMAATAYLALPEEQQIKVLALFGYSPAYLVLAGVAAAVAAQFVKQNLPPESPSALDEESAPSSEAAGDPPESSRES